MSVEDKGSRNILGRANSFKLLDWLKKNETALKQEKFRPAVVAERASNDLKIEVSETHILRVCEDAGLNARDYCLIGHSRHPKADKPLPKNMDETLRRVATQLAYTQRALINVGRELGVDIDGRLNPDWLSKIGSGKTNLKDGEQHESNGQPVV